MELIFFTACHADIVHVNVDYIRFFSTTDALKLRRIATYYKYLGIFEHRSAVNESNKLRFDHN